MEAYFLMGICRYYEGDFDGAIQQFRMVLAEVPLNEVYNDLGAALSRKDDNAAAEENFKQGAGGRRGRSRLLVQYRLACGSNAIFEQAAQHFRAVLDRSQERSGCDNHAGAVPQRKVRAPAIPEARGANGSKRRLRIRHSGNCRLS